MVSTYSITPSSSQETESTRSSTTSEMSDVIWTREFERKVQTFAKMALRCLLLFKYAKLQKLEVVNVPLVLRRLDSMQLLALLRGLTFG